MKDQSKDAKGKAEAPANKSQPAQSQPQAKTPVLMKKGDYTVHLLIEEVKSLLPKQQDFLPLPVVKASCFSKSKRTQRVSTQCLEFSYNEHFYFEGVDLSYEELNSQKVVIEVYDSKNTNREDYFGIYEFDLEYIYSMPSHAIKNLWIALANPEAKDIAQVRGYLKLSLSVLNENDERVELLPNPAKQSDCLIPPQIKITYQQISIYIFKAEELPDMDNIIGKEKTVARECNGYVECHYMGAVRQTKVVDMVKETIKWNEVIDLSVSIPAVSQKISFAVKDYNKVTKDVIIGSFEVTIKDILENRYENLQDINIYGSPIKDSGVIGTKMNMNAEFGSRWKGRLSLMIKNRAVDTPINGVRAITDEALLKTVYNTSRANLWSVYVKLFDAYYLPEKDSKYSIKISMQDSSAVFPITKAENRNIKWNLCKALQCQTLTNSNKELPDLFLYLMNENDEPICFQRIQARLFHMKDLIRMIKLIPDPCIGKVSKMYLSGILKIRIKIFNRDIDKGEIDLSNFKDGETDQIASSIGKPGMVEDDEDDLEKMLAKKTEPQKPQEKKDSPMKAYTVVANIYMSRYLIPSDISGTSDPYTQLTIFSQQRETTVKNNSVNGIWNESLIFDNITFDVNNQSTWPVMLVTVMDKDIASSDMLGYNYIWLCDSMYEINNTNRIKPKWHQLYLERSNRAQGQILLSFYILDLEHQGLISQINIIPETTPYTVEINALGLRKLKPLSFLPVKKAYVSFDLNSINVTGKKEDALAPIKTQPKDSGENPNLTAVIQFDVKLPKDDVFIPEMQCEVYDYVLGGMINQLLGIFILSIKDIINDTHYTFQQDERITQELLTRPKREFIEQPIIYPIRQAVLHESELPESEDKLQIESETSLKAPLVKDDDDDDDDEIIGQPKQLKEKKHDVSILCTTVADLGNVFKGTIDVNEVIKNKNNPDYFVIKPSFMQYTIPGLKATQRDFKEFLIEDEANSPPLEFYFPLGFNKETNQSRKDDLLIKDDRDSDKNKKHYRRIFGKELEKMTELGLGSPFTKCNLVRGKYYDTDDTTGLFEAISNPNNKIIKSFGFDESHVFKMVSGLGKTKEDTELIQKNISAAFDLKYYGEFKGLIRISEKSRLKAHEDLVEKIKAMNKGKIPLEYDYLTKFEEISRHMLIKKLVIIRVYILELNNLEKKDQFSESDPYIRILLGKDVKVDEKENKLDDLKDCKWYKHYDILTELPGNGAMTIQVWDYDAIFSDELIGETVIDLEDRYFDHQWQDLKTKPVEVRKLRHPDYSQSQGELLMWMEIFDKNDRTHMTPWNIEPEPESTLELRLIVWETENMECMDVEGTSDIYVLAYLDQDLRQSTDVHFRCQTGAASFNWRMVIPIKLPRKSYELVFQVYDNDILARDDFICGGKLNLYKLIRDVNVLDVPITFNRDYFNALPLNEKYPNVEFLSASDDADGVKFWVQMVKGENLDKKGRVLCSLELLPKWRADLTKVGKGREEPNVDPFLPPPVGRFEFSMNPFKMLNQLVGPKFRRKLYCAICCCVFIVYLIIVIPYMIYHVGGELVNPFNYLGRRK